MQRVLSFTQVYVCLGTLVSPERRFVLATSEVDLYVNCFNDEAKQNKKAPFCFL